jgi:hypothetical protein
MMEAMEASTTRIHAVADNAVTEDLIGENRLWTAVIVKAVEDWRMGTLRARREAQKFLFEDDRDFKDVCASAGLDPSRLRAQLLRIGRKIEMEGAFRNPLAA